jgi:RNA polymerase sigma factor for flagellar operon FliA
VTPDQERLIDGHMRLAEALAIRTGNHIAASYHEREDIQGDAYLGLTKAARSFEPARSTFMTYASIRINGAIRDGMRARDRLNRSARVHATEYHDAEMQCARRLQRMPTLAEIARELGCSLRVASEYRRIAETCNVSLRAVGVEAIRDDDPTAHEAVDGEYPSLSDAVKRLSEREQVLVGMRYWENRTQVEVARVLGVTPVRISQLQAQALGRLRALVGTAEAA